MSGKIGISILAILCAIIAAAFAISCNSDSDKSDDDSDEAPPIIYYAVASDEPMVGLSAADPGICVTETQEAPRVECDGAGCLAIGVDVYSPNTSDVSFAGHYGPYEQTQAESDHFDAVYYVSEDQEEYLLATEGDVSIAEGTVEGQYLMNYFIKFEDDSVKQGSWTLTPCE